MSHLSAASIIDGRFVDSVQNAYGLEGLYVGRHIVRDARQWKIGEMAVERLWLAEIDPSFMEPSCLSLLRADQQQLAVFAVLVEQHVITVGPIEINLKDPVEDAFRCFDASSSEKAVTLDGISYSIFFHTFGLQLAMEFSNPRSPHLLALEMAVFHVATMLSPRDKDSIVENYLRNWGPYLSTSQRT
jgi:hypothetical protein